MSDIFERWDNSDKIPTENDVKIYHKNNERLLLQIPQYPFPAEVTISAIAADGAYFKVKSNGFFGNAQWFRTDEVRVLDIITAPAEVPEDKPKAASPLDMVKKIMEEAAKKRTESAQAGPPKAEEPKAEEKLKPKRRGRPKKEKE